MAHELTYALWLEQVKSTLKVKYGFEADAAEAHVDEAPNEWADYYDMGFSPSAAVAEDAAHWES